MRDVPEASAPTGNSGTFPFDQSISQVAALTEPAPGTFTPRQRQHAPPWMRVLTLALPFVSVAFLMLATWLPWVSLRAIFSDPGVALPNPASTVTFDAPYNGANGFLGLLARVFPSAPLQFRAVSLIWSAWPLVGLLLSLFFLRQRQQKVSKTLLALYGGWLALTTIITIAVIYGLLTIVAPLSCWQTCSPMSVTNRQPNAGLLIVLTGLGLGWLALGLLRGGRNPLSATAPAVSTAQYSPLHLIGAGVFSLGAALWAFAVLAIPWATSGCTGLHLSLNHFAQGSCSGVDGWDVFIAGLGSRAALGIVAVELVPTVGLFAVISVWLPRLIRSTWVTTLGWILLLTALFFIGIVGVGATIAHPPVLTSFAHDPWVAGQGDAVCGFGILLGWVGAAILGREEVHYARQRRVAGASSGS
ncbi:MAG: hypothetical protein ACM3N4_07705 [Nitrososphaerota archaeon]